MNRQEQDATIEQAQKTLHDAALNLNSTSVKSLNRGDHFVQTVQTVESEDDFYNRNAATLQSASNAIADLSRGDILKKTPGDFLAVAKKVMDALDVVKQVHPFVGVAVIAFTAVVNLELKRRENDRRVSSMIAQATDMMGMLLQLKDVKDPNITGLYGETIEGRLQDVMKHIAQDIEDCGNAIDKYCKSKFIVKFFRSDTWANKFLDICKSFSDRKDELKLELNIRTALKVDIAIDKLEQLIQMKSERESRFSAVVKLHGGREKCMESPDLLAELVDTSEQWEARPQNRSHIEPPSKNDNRLASKTISANEQNRLVSLLLYELNTPLRRLLNENRAYFKLAVDTQTSRITDTINASEERIIRTINTNNIFQQVDDPHLRYIWKQMKWRTNVKTQYFIAELHYYYTNRFFHLHRDGWHTETSDAPSLVVPVQYPDHTPDSAAEGEGHGPAINRADEWCLKYLTVFYVPSLSEGFDSDANSLVSIREVNQFTSAKPLDWSLLQALAYWAAGWRVDSKYYQTHIEGALESMIIAQSNALPENKVCISSYLDSYTIIGVKKLVRFIAQLDSEEYYDSDLRQLASWRRKVQEEELASKLNAVKYEIDSKDSIKIFGSGRIENFLLPLLYLVIRRHLQIMKLASTVILVEEELQFAAQSIDNILEVVDLRVRQLAVTFRQQGTDPQMRFAWYAYGLYKIWYSPNLNPDDTEYWATNFFNIIDDAGLDSIDISALKFGPFSLEGASEQLERPDQPVTSSSGRDPEGVKEEYIHLWCFNDFHDNYRSFNAPPCISPEEKSRFNILSRELRHEDIQCWSSLAHLCSRKRYLCRICDACDRPVIDVNHNCIDCGEGEFDLCVECESPSEVSKCEYPSNHNLTHNMLVSRIPQPIVVYQRARWISGKFLSTLLPGAALPEGFLTTQDDGSEPQSDEPAMNPGTSVACGDTYTCAECGVMVMDVFYVCVNCGEKEKPIAMCSNCAFHDSFNVVEKHNYTHSLVKIKDKLKHAHGTSEEEPMESKKADEASTLEVLSSRVDKLAAMVESRFAELDRRLGELIEKVHLSSESV